MISEGQYLSAISGGDSAKQHYLDAFRKFDAAGGKFVATWNWPAFFFAGLWTLYRGLYGWFFINLLAIIIFAIIGRALELGHPSDAQWNAVKFSALAVQCGFAVLANFIFYKKINKKISSSEREVHPVPAISPSGAHKTVDAGGTIASEGPQWSFIPSESTAGNVDDWLLVIEHFPSIKSIEDSLSFYPNGLRSTFVSTLLANKRFDEAEKLASELRNDFLRERFGSDGCLREFGRRLIENSEAKAAEELSRTITALGRSVSCEQIMEKIIKKYSLEASVYFKNVYRPMDSDKPVWASDLPPNYSIYTDGVSFLFQAQEDQKKWYQDYTADSEDDAKNLVQVIKKEVREKERKWAKQDTFGWIFIFVFMFLLLILSISLLRWK